MILGSTDLMIFLAFHFYFIKISNMIFKVCIISILITTILLSSAAVSQINIQFYPKVKSVPVASILAEMDRILNDSIFSDCFIGVKIIQLPDGNILYKRNSHKLFHPASNLKLLTSAAAINVFKTDFHFRTKVYTDHNISNGILHGNLYIKGSGDPLVTIGDLDSLASLIKTKGITTIKGDIIGDISYFDSVYWGRGWMWDDEPSAYYPFISPLSVNDNSVKIFIKPGHKIGDTVSITAEPISSYYEISNNGMVSTDSLFPDLFVTRQRDGNKIIVNGKMSPNDLIKEFSISLWKPELAFLHLLREHLNLDSINVNGKVRLGQIQGKIQLAEISRPIDSVIHRMNKVSDNLAAENILKVLGAEKYGTPGTSLNGLMVLKEYLYGLDIDTSKIILADGSGVSWYNEISPHVITKLMQHQYKNKATFQRFYESLAIAGVDGTLKNRMRNTQAANNVRAKTGSLNGVSGISGYVTTANGKMLAFSILCNHYSGEIGKLRDAQDKILELLAKSKIK